MYSFDILTDIIMLLVKMMESKKAPTLIGAFDTQMAGMQLVVSV